MTRPEDPGALGTALAIAELGMKIGRQQYLRSPYFFLSPLKRAAIELILT